tara:strand:- start:2637 stop:4148 length:1512 start_codon:yes stop_codon:yes gene_type:complete
MNSKNENPDIVNFLANLSNDEVFTPSKFAIRMLDELPNHIWSNPNIKILDPSCKTGIFLREAASRLNKGLKNKIKDDKKRINHILKNQIFGIAITELTSLVSRRSIYYSRDTNSKFSVCKKFNNGNGNIIYNEIQHVWNIKNRCEYCGATKVQYSRNKDLEKYAYEFIHTRNPQELFKNMKFDVIIGNPPYQLSDGGHSRSATTIYHLFVENAKKLNPKYLTMVIQSRWFVGGKGLDNFRKDMLSDTRIKKIVDFESSSDVFPGPDIAGGVNYFLWDRDHNGKCEIINVRKNQERSTIRSLDEYEILIRDSQALQIIKNLKKLNINNGKTLSDRVSPRKPFGLPTNYLPKNSGTPCWFIQKIGKKFAKSSDISDTGNLIKKWKLLIPKAPIAGQTDFSKPVGFYYDGNVQIAKPGECCTESWIVAGVFTTEKEAIYFKSYLFTKTVRFLLLQAVISQDVTRRNFMFVPDLISYDRKYDDKYLVKKWNISEKDWKYIDSRITAS